MSRGTVVALQVVLWVAASLGVVLGMVAASAMVVVPSGRGVPPAVWAVGSDAVALGCAYGAGCLRAARLGHKQEVLR
jgi:hypothetical protein